MEQRILTVSELTQSIKQRLENDPALMHVCVKGEISSYKIYSSGHHYFSVKDEGAILSCVMFRASAVRLRFTPKVGMAVLAVGSVGVYPRDGKYQFRCESLTPFGVGDLHMAFEQLKEKLMQEGLFSEAHKKPLPRFPHTIAVITSQEGKAIHDILQGLRKRYPLCKVILMPVRVQGAEAPREIAGAIAYANCWSIADVIITGRGGGSPEELWAFNDERVARAIYASEIPVVSAVGHEPDVLISDFVADVRASTPTRAAEYVAPDRIELSASLNAMRNSMSLSMQKRVKLLGEQLRRLAGAHVLKSPMSYVEDRRQRLDASSQKLLYQASNLLEHKKRKLLTLAASLDAMSPLRVLARGYSMSYDKDGTIIRAASQVSAGERIRVVTGKGSIHAVADRIEEESI